MEKRLSVVLLYLALGVGLVVCDKHTENIEKNIKYIFEPNQCVNGKECVKRNLCDESERLVANGKDTIAFRSGCKTDEICCTSKNKKNNVSHIYCPFKQFLTESLTVW